MVSKYTFRLFVHSFKHFYPFLSTGDLTDSVAPGKVTQFIEEWKMYEDVYTKCQNESGVAHWLDLRGNHGNRFSNISPIIV